MDSIRQYILSISAAALLCSIVKALVGKKTGNGMVVELICGTFMAVTLLSPWLDWNIQDITLYTDGIKSDAATISELAQERTEAEIRKIIKDESEAYILDKASSMEMDITVEVILQETDPIPVCAVIAGNVSPYNRTVLSQYIENTLAITEDAQVWNSKQ